MKKTPADLMQEATRLTLAGDTAGAAALLQAALSGQQSEPTASSSVNPAKDTRHFVLDSAQAAGIPAGSFTDGLYLHHDTELHYKLFVPTREHQEPAPLLLMLHGCSQTTQDFAVGTRMNDIAQASGMIVIYPAQSTTANPNKCWNWFEPAHQFRGGGEPEALSALTLHVMESQPVDPKRVYVAGFSAGGSMALILAEQYPELYAAVGVHSGLPTGAASSNMDAFRLMQGASTGNTGSTTHAGGDTVNPSGQESLTGSGHAAQTRNADDIHTPLIVFHGSQDRFVNTANADRIIANWLVREKTRTVPTNWLPLSLPHNTATGRHFIVTTYAAEEQPERTGCEYWQLSEGGHGWSGGSSSGSHTEQNGPDASAEMVRFFLECESA